MPEEPISMGECQVDVKQRQKRNANLQQVQIRCLTPPISSWTAAMRLVRVAVPAFLLMLASVSANGQSTVGYRDFSFGTTDATPTGEKPESKLWFNDGVWWGSMFNTATSTYHIYRFNASTQSWTDTGTQIDNRHPTRADCLWDGGAQKLYVASHIFIDDNSTLQTSSSQWGRLYRYSYHSSTQSYTLDSGFPVTVNQSNSETLVIAKDTTGVLWVTFTQGSKVYVNHSAVGNDAQWGTPFLVPTTTRDPHHTTP